jgi:hypothetical protein
LLYPRSKEQDAKKRKVEADASAVFKRSQMVARQWRICGGDLS